MTPFLIFFIKNQDRWFIVGNNIFLVTGVQIRTPLAWENPWVCKFNSWMDIFRLKCGHFQYSPLLTKIFHFLIKYCLQGLRPPFSEASILMAVSLWPHTRALWDSRPGPRTEVGPIPVSSMVPRYIQILGPSRVPKFRKGFCQSQSGSQYWDQEAASSNVYCNSYLATNATKTKLC